MTRNHPLAAAFTAEPLIVAGSLMLFVGGTALLLQVPSARETARAVVLDPRTRAAGRQAAKILGKAILESLTTQFRRVALPSSTD